MRGVKTNRTRVPPSPFHIKRVYSYTLGVVIMRRVCLHARTREDPPTIIGNNMMMARTEHRRAAHVFAVLVWVQWHHTAVVVDVVVAAGDFDADTSLRLTASSVRV